LQWAVAAHVYGWSFHPAAFRSVLDERPAIGYGIKNIGQQIIGFADFFLQGRS